MRSTLACQWCRNAKIKCHHNGSPPCRSCISHPGRECVLSTPNHVSRRANGSFKLSKDNTTRNPGCPRGSDLLVAPASSEHSAGKQSKEALDHRSPLAGLNKKILEDAFNAFVRHFPEFNFFHQPSFLRLLDEERVPVLLLCVILALTSRFVPEIVGRYGSPGEASRFFGNHVRQMIMSHTTLSMDLHFCQALVMLCLYDWGEGSGSRAWIYNGMASRIAHGVYARTKQLAEKDDLGSHNSHLEEARRTVWACFLIDAMIGCGKCQASSHSLSVREVSLPIGEDDFAFEKKPTQKELFLDLCDPEVDECRPLLPSSINSMGCDRSLTLVIQGFHIWHTISAWASAGGRKRHSLAARAAPWQSHSFYARSLAALEAWRASQHPQMHYSTSNMNLRVYISRGEGERFAVINLVYYLSIIFLYREYISTERILFPSLPDTPSGWFEQRSQDLLAAASNIIRIMQELDQRGIQFHSPFTCFCVFSAATWLLHATQVPPNPTGEGEPEPQFTPSQLLSWAFSWLDRACKVWKLACGWYRTLLMLSQFYTQTGADPMHLAHSRKDILPMLEENMQRLAGSEPPESRDQRANANILLLLQRQQNQTQARSRLCAAMPTRDTIQTSSGNAAGLGEGESMASMPDCPRPVLGAEIPPPLPSPFHLDQDLLANILGDSSGDWLQPFFDTTQFLGEWGI